MSFWLPPETMGRRLVRWFIHFVLGVMVGSLPAVLVFAAVSISPTANLLRAAVLVFVGICVPFGLLFWLIGLVDRGRVLYRLLSVLGMQFDADSF
jgi:hypothetical protein